MSVTYEEIKYPPDVFDEISTLLQAHKDELCTFGEDVILDPDWVNYKRLADAGILQVVFARNEDRELVGYTVNIMIRHLHYNFIIAVNDILYFKPEYRGHGIRLIKFTERCLKARGVNIYSLSIKPHLDFSPVVERFGYQLLESNYWRRLQ